MTDKPDDSDRIRTAYHEAAHAVTAWRLGRDVLAVSVDPHGDHYGHVSHSSTSMDAVVADWSVPIQGELREKMEGEIIISLAGHLGEDLVGPRSGYGLRPDHDWAERAATVLAEISPRHKELAERGEPISADERFARGGSYGLAGSEANQHLAWMQAVAQRLVGESVRRIERLAEVLLAEPTRVIDGGRVTAIIEGTGT